MNKIRLAVPADAVSILDIYRHYILHTSLTFETEVPAHEAFCGRVISCLESRPWLVCEIDGILAGYAYAGRYRERTAYQWSVESSVYVRDEFQRKGIAKALYAALFDILRHQQYRNVYAVINLPNDKSVAFHESCGFTWFADYKNVGYKLGEWKTVGWWQLQLNDYSDNPAIPVSLPYIDATFLESVFVKALKQT